MSPSATGPCSVPRSLHRPPRAAGRLWRGLAALALAGLAAAAQAGPGYVSTVWASGLNAPRGLSFGPDGALWIAEAGAPGAPGGPSTIIRGEAVYYAETGSVTRVFGGTQSRIFSGLPTLFVGSTGQMEGGPTDIAFGASGTLHVLLGYAGIHPGLRLTDLAPGGYQLGRLLTLGGAVDVAAHEAAYNPDGAGIESNPWNLAPSASGGMYVTDAAANALLHVGADGSIDTVAVFPPRSLGGPFPTQAVPTGVALGPDGAVYVSELTGFPFPGGASRVSRVAADGSVSVFADGFTMAVDIAFDDSGNLYVLEHDSNGLLAPGSLGQLWQVTPGGSRSLLWSEGLVSPVGLAIGPDGAFYVSNYGNNGAGMGQVLRISPVPEAGSAVLLALGLVALMPALRRRSLRAQGGAES